MLYLLTQTTKVRQRFFVKPSTAHIVCMKAVPGNIEESLEFTDSANVNVHTSWVNETFSPLGKDVMIHLLLSGFLYVQYIYFLHLCNEQS